jgi:hypothetical protein
MTTRNAGLQAEVRKAKHKARSKHEIMRVNKMRAEGEAK